MFSATADSLDDLILQVYRQILSSDTTPFQVCSRKGNSSEIFGVLLNLRDPRARLSRSRSRGRLYSSLGEVLWYLAGSNSLEHITHYIARYGEFSNDGETTNGAYGPRIFGKSAPSLPQWDRVIATLRARPGSRNGVIQILKPEDISESNKDIPCTSTLHFAVRNGRLNLHVHMRSNDAFLGLPHDIFSFTFLQEIAASELECGLGEYFHSVASLHLYHDNDKYKWTTMARQYLKEGWQEFRPMPSMPKGNPWPSIKEVIIAERRIREGDLSFEPNHSLDPYWLDLVTLLKVHKCLVDCVDERSIRHVGALISNLSAASYRVFVLDRVAHLRPDLVKALRNLS